MAAKPDIRVPKSVPHEVSSTGPCASCLSDAAYPSPPFRARKETTVFLVVVRLLGTRAVHVEHRQACARRPSFKKLYNALCDKPATEVENLIPPRHSRSERRGLRRGILTCPS